MHLSRLYTYPICIYVERTVLMFTLGLIKLEQLLE